MNAVFPLIKRNTKLFFKDKGMFFTSLITPVILLVLYTTFLSNVYKDTFVSTLPSELILPDGIINGLVGGQLISSLLSVSCVTVAFCSNFLMVQDKANGSLKDIKMSPVNSASLSVAYYLSSLFSTLIICFTASILSFVYLGVIGWYISITDILLIMADVTLLVFFGTALSSVINFFLSTQGQISAVGTVISAGYGFICGAYMPISSFGETLRKIVTFLPGTYGTSLLRNHSTRGVLSEMEALGIPEDTVRSIKDSIDCNIYFFEKNVEPPIMYLILFASVIFLVGIFLLLNKLKKRN